MQRHLIGDDDASRQRLREEVLGTTRADFRHFAAALARFPAASRTAVLGSEPAITAANAERPDLLAVSRVL